MLSALPTVVVPVAVAVAVAGVVVAAAVVAVAGVVVVVAAAVVVGVVVVSLSRRGAVCRNLREVMCHSPDTDEFYYAFDFSATAPKPPTNQRQGARAATVVADVVDHAVIVAVIVVIVVIDVVDVVDDVAIAV